METTEETNIRNAIAKKEAEVLKIIEEVSQLYSGGIKWIDKEELTQKIKNSQK